MSDHRPFVRLETVTPEKAGKWLKLNTHNRDLAATRVKTLVGAVERGEFRLTGDAIVFAGSGEGDVLLNGQHRLHAVVQAGKPIQAIVLYNAEKSAQEAMDSGASRTLGAKLKLRGESYYNDLSSALALAFSYDKLGEPRSSGSFSTHQQLLDYLERNPQIRHYAAPAWQLRKEFGTLGGSWMGWWFLCARNLGNDLADTFFQSLLDGAELEINNPIYHLRKALIKQMGTPKDRRFGSRMIGAFIVKCFNAWALGQDMAQLKWDVRESFPRLVTQKELRTLVAA